MGFSHFRLRINAAINILVLQLWVNSMCAFVEYTPRVEFLGYRIGICVALVDFSKSFSEVVVLIYVSSSST